MKGEMTHNKGEVSGDQPERKEGGGAGGGGRRCQQGLGARDSVILFCLVLGLVLFPDRPLVAHHWGR